MASGCVCKSQYVPTKENGFYLLFQLQRASSVNSKKFLSQKPVVLAENWVQIRARYAIQLQVDLLEYILVAPSKI